MHERIGAAIEQLYADSLNDHLPELAHHFSRAAKTDQAVKYLMLAGVQSLGRYAYTEASARLTEGLRHLERLPESRDRDVRELELASALVEATWRVAIEAPETEEAIERGIRLAEKTGNLAEQIKHLNFQTSPRLAPGEFARSNAMSDRLLQLAEREGIPVSFSSPPTPRCRRGSTTETSLKLKSNSCFGGNIRPRLDRQHFEKEISSSWQVRRYVHGYWDGPIWRASE